MVTRPAATRDLHALRQALGEVVGAGHVQDSGPDIGAECIARPASTAEVAAIVTLAVEHGVGILAQGGHLGGCESRSGPMLLSLSRMAAIEAIYPEERVAIVQAGSLQNAATPFGLEPGIDIAARGTATIGGMVSTNAGGIMAHRHGVMRHRVPGLEAVLPDGSIFSDMTRVVKNTAGYDLKHLSIGAEGTLGIVTRIVLKLEPLPNATATVMLGLPSVAAALEAIDLAPGCDAGHLRAAEGLRQSYIQLTARAQGWSEPSFPLDQPVCLLLMLGGANQAELTESIEKVLGEILDRHPTATGIIAASKRQEADLWRLSEDTDQLYRVPAAAPCFDVSVLLSEVGAYVAHVERGLARIDPGLVPYVFGHLADGNLHIVLNRAGPLDDDLSAAVEHVLYAGLRELGGSFSAEHGVGAKRRSALVGTSDPTKLATMMRIKQILDPDLTFDPGKVLPLQPLAREKIQ